MTGWRAVLGPDRVRTIGWLLLGATPLVWIGSYFGTLYADSLTFRCDGWVMDAPTRIATVWASSILILKFAGAIRDGPTVSMSFSSTTIKLPTPIIASPRWTTTLRQWQSCWANLFRKGKSLGCEGCFLAKTARHFCCGRCVDKMTIPGVLTSFDRHELPMH